MKLDIIIWRDEQPGADSAEPIAVTMRVIDSTGHEAPHDLVMERAVLEHDGQRWELPIQQSDPGAPAKGPSTIRGALDWPAGSTVNATVWVRSATGEHVLRERDIRIRRAE